MNKLIEKLKSKNMTLCCVESLTGGLFASTVTSIPGVSSVFKGGVVTYWNEIKNEVVGVSKDTIDQYGVVSSECASEMARGAKRMFSSNVAISFTGNAGPTSMEGKPVGLVYIGVVIDKTVFTFEYIFEGDRNTIRNKCVEAGINKILELL